MRLLAILSLALAVAACGPATPKFQGSDVTGAPFGRDFHLVDHNGKPRSLADFRGKAVVVFFGYTQCPDFCPTTLAELAAAMQKLGPDASRVQVLFVTVDPSFIGLFGDDKATSEVAREFKIIYQKQPGKTPGSYTLDHSAGTYIFDPQGRLRVYENYGPGPDVYAHDLREVLKPAA